MGEKESEPFQFTFNGFLKVAFQGSRVTSDAGNGANVVTFRPGGVDGPGVGTTFAKAMANGYPMYRLEWQTLGSLQRRLRNCINGMRTQNFDFGAPELVELELYLMSRARGLPAETPAVRP